MPNTTRTQVTDAVAQHLDRTLLVRAYPHFVHAMWAQVRDLPSNASAVIKFRRYGSLTAATTALTEGVTPAGSQLSITDISSTVAQYGDYVTTTDFLDMTVIENLKTELAEILGDQMGDTIDRLVRTVLEAGTTIQYASTATTTATVAAGMILNGAEVREAVRTLQSNSAKTITSQIDPSDGFNSSPVAAAFIGIISEDTLFDLKKDSDWVPVEEYSLSDGRLGAFEKGKLDDVRFVLAGSNASVSAAGGAGSIDVHRTIILAQEAYGISRISGEAAEVITKPLGSSGTADPLNQRATMGWKITFVATRLNENFLLRIEHAVSS